jgi:hypothetical protein
VSEARHGQIVYFTRGHERVAALVSPEVAAAGTAAIEALEDVEDNLAADEALAESGARYSHESIKAELGLI